MKRDEEGTSSAIAFALAGVLFIGAISTVLVYTNDRIPPPAKSQPHEESTAEARQLLQGFVLAVGNQTWTGTAWSGATDGSGAQRPGLRCAPPTCAAGAYKLDRAKLLKLKSAETDSTGTYQYEELRTLLGMTARGRGFHIVVAYTSNETVLLDYGNAPPERVANRPAPAYLTLDNGIPVRVAVQVFLDS